MIVRCGYEIDPCLEGEDQTRQTRRFETNTIAHNKDIKTILSIAGVDIPLRVRKRSFSLVYEHGWKHNNLVVLVDLQLYEHECFDNEVLDRLSVAEDSTWTDSSVYILDTEHSNAFWKEVTYTCKFDGSSKDRTGFIWPSWGASKLRFNDVHYVITTKWKLMVNGVVETLYTTTGVKPLYTQDRPLFFVYPMPMSGVSTDDDFGELPGKTHSYSFLDYRTGGFGPTAEEIASGGKDYYHPEYLWYMGDHREEDQTDARQRFDDTFGIYTSVKDTEVRVVGFPRIWGPEDPRGSIVRDFAGNTFASVTVTKQDGDLLHFNRFVNSDGTSIAIPETIPGSDVRYYPVGLI